MGKLHGVKSLESIDVEGTKQLLSLSASAGLKDLPIRYVKYIRRAVNLVVFFV